MDPNSFTLPVSTITFSHKFHTTDKNNDQCGLFANRSRCLFNTPVGARTFLTLMMWALGDSTLVCLWPPNTHQRTSAFMRVRALRTALMVGLILTGKRQSFEAQDTRSWKQAGNYRVKSSDFFFITVNFLPPGRTKSYTHPCNHGVWFSCVRLMQRYHPIQQWLDASPLCLRWQTRRRAHIKAKPVTKNCSSVHGNPTLTWLLFQTLLAAKPASLI